jgi:hypothetical protein
MLEPIDRYEWRRCVPPTHTLPDDDFDDDHSSNYNEFIADTDPAAAASGLRLTSFVRSNQVVRCTVGGIKATRYLTGAHR